MGNPGLHHHRSARLAAYLLVALAPAIIPMRARAISGSDVLGRSGNWAVFRLFTVSKHSSTSCELMSQAPGVGLYFKQTEPNSGKLGVSKPLESEFGVFDTSWNLHRAVDGELWISVGHGKQTYTIKAQVNATGREAFGHKKMSQKIFSTILDLLAKNPPMSFVEFDKITPRQADMRDTNVSLSGFPEAFQTFENCVRPLALGF